MLSSDFYLSLKAFHNISPQLFLLENTLVHQLDVVVIYEKLVIIEGRGEFGEENGVVIERLVGRILDFMHEGNGFGDETFDADGVWVVRGFAGGNWG